MCLASSLDKRLPICSQVWIRSLFSLKNGSSSFVASLPSACNLKNVLMISVFVCLNVKVKLTSELKSLKSMGPIPLFPLRTHPCGPHATCQEISPGSLRSPTDLTSAPVPQIAIELLKTRGVPCEGSLCSLDPSFISFASSHFACTDWGSSPLLCISKKRLDFVRSRTVASSP